MPRQIRHTLIYAADYALSAAADSCLFRYYDGCYAALFSIAATLPMSCRAAARTLMLTLHDAV